MQRRTPFRFFQHRLGIILRLAALQFMLIPWRAAGAVNGPVPVAKQDALQFSLTNGRLNLTRSIIDDRGKAHFVQAAPDRLSLLSNDLIDFQGAAQVSCYEYPGPKTSPGSPPNSDIKFTNVSDKLGIKHKHRQHKPVRPYCLFPIVIPIANSNKTIRLDGEFCSPEQITGAVAAGDYDNDGHVDLFFTVADGRSRLYRNNGNGTFVDVTIDSGVGPPKFGSGAVWADVDGDGDLDLFVTSLGGKRHYLYINRGGVFTEEAVQRNISVQQASNRVLSGMTPNAGDYDRDGFIDIYVSEWALSSIGKPSASALMHNLGRSKPGYFEDVTRFAGVIMDGYSLQDTGVDGWFTFCSSFTDLDNDGWGDMIITSDYGLSRIFWNEHNGTFTECTGQCGINVRADAMGHSMGDWDLDGNIDWWMTAIHHNSSIRCDVIGCGFSNIGNLFHRNLGNRSMSDYTDLVGVRKGAWGWGNALIDFNNDRWLDFLMTNGFNEGGTTVDDLFSQDPSRLWENLGPKHSFGTVEASSKYKIYHKKEGRGLIKVDYDDDGDEDVIIVNHIDAPTIYRNDGGNRFNWIKIRAMHQCIQLAKLCDSIAARVTVKSVDGYTQLQEVGSGSQFMGQNELTTHFGLGNISSPVNVTVTWPWLNSAVTYTGVPPNVKLRVVAPTAPSKTSAAFSTLKQCPRLTIANVSQPQVGNITILPGDQAVSWAVTTDQLKDVNSTINFDYSLRMTPATGFIASGIVSISPRMLHVSDGGVAEEDCDGAQFLPSKFPKVTDSRPITGFSNNKKNLLWGAVGTNLRRQVKAAYIDNRSAPSGQCTAKQRSDRTCLYPLLLQGDGSMRPSPRNISNVIFRQIENIYSKRGLSDMHTQWGQFIAHDTDFSSPLPRFEFQTERNDVWLPILVPKGDVHFDPYNRGDQYLPFLRTTFTSCSGGFTKYPREHFNKITSIIDGSLVYGVDAERNRALRTMKDGKMKLDIINGESFIPYNIYGQNNDNPVGRKPESLLLAGDSRANVQPGLIVLHTVFVREHNRLCDIYKTQNPKASDEQIFQYARRILIAELQSITYREFLPALIGHKFPSYKSYNSALQPDVSSIFATAAFRFGHSQVNTHMWRFDAVGRVIPEGHVPLREVYFTPERVTREGGIDPYLRGMVEQRAQEVDTKMVDDMRNVLFPVARKDGLDLAALNIQRGRDHGLPDYNSARLQLGLKSLKNFSDISSNASVVAQFQEVYSSIDVIDPWVGGLAEDKQNGSEVGAFFEEILVSNFVAIRDGDRFWYERFLTKSEIDLVHNLTLSEIIRLNTGVKNITKDVFFSTRFCQNVVNFQCIPRPSPTCADHTSSTTEPPTTAAATTLLTTPPMTTPTPKPAATTAATTKLATTAAATSVATTVAPTESPCCNASRACNVSLTESQAIVNKLQKGYNSVNKTLKTIKAQLANEQVLQAECQSNLTTAYRQQQLLTEKARLLNNSLANQSLVVDNLANCLQQVANLSHELSLSQQPPTTLSTSSTTTSQASATVDTVADVQENLTECQNNSATLQDKLHRTAALLDLTSHQLSNTTANISLLLAALQNTTDKLSLSDQKLLSCSRNAAFLQQLLLDLRHNATVTANATRMQHQQELDSCKKQNASCLADYQTIMTNLTNCELKLQTLSCSAQLTSLQTQLQKCQAKLYATPSAPTAAQSSPQQMTLQPSSSFTTTQLQTPSLSTNSQTKTVQTSSALSSASTSPPQAMTTQPPTTTQPNTTLSTTTQPNTTLSTTTQPNTTLSTTTQPNTTLSTTTQPMTPSTTTKQLTTRTQQGTKPSGMATAATPSDQTVTLTAELNKLQQTVAHLQTINDKLSTNITTLEATLIETEMNKSREVSAARQGEQTAHRLFKQEKEKRESAYKQLHSMTKTCEKSTSENALTTLNIVLIAALAVIVFVIVAAVAASIIRRYRRSKNNQYEPNVVRGEVFYKNCKDADKEVYPMSSTSW